MKKSKILLGVAGVGMTICAVPALSGGDEAENLVSNPGFEDGFNGWGGANDKSSWYEKPKDAGMSKITATEETSHSGKIACLMTGCGNRGLLVQHFSNLTPGEKYKFSGWLKTENMTDAKAVIDIVYYNKKDGRQKWLGAYEIGSLDGDSGGWVKVEKTLPVLEGTNMLVFQLRTTEPNKGKAWFDDISITKEKAGSI